MYCQKCGNQVKDGASFCNQCGCQFKGNNTTPTPAQSVLPARNSKTPAANVAAKSIRTNNEEHINKMIVTALFILGALFWLFFFIILITTKFGAIADFIEIAESSFLNKERIINELQEMYDVSPVMILLISFSVMANFFVKGISLYLSNKKRNFRKNKRNVIINSVIDIAEMIIGTFIFWQITEGFIGFRNDTSLSVAFYVLFLLAVVMEALYDWCYIKAAESEAKFLYQASLPVGEWKCSHCGTINSKNDLFCKSCNKNFEKTGWTCTACGLLNKNSDLSCKGCGKYK